MNELNIMGWIALLYAFVSSIFLMAVGFDFPITTLGYIPWLIALSLIIQKNEYE